MFRTAIRIAQLLTSAVVATANDKMLDAAMKNKFTSINSKIQQAISVIPAYTDAQNETTIKNYVNRSLEGTIKPLSVDFSLFKSAAIKYDSIGKFFDKFFDSITMIHQLQQFKTNGPEMGINYFMLIETVHCFHTFKWLVKSEVLPVDEQKNLSFDVLYEYIRQLLPQNETNANKILILDSINTALETIVTFINEYWDMESSKFKKITANNLTHINNASKNIIGKVQKEFLQAIHHMCNNKEIEYDAYVKIRSLYGVVSKIVHHLACHINGIAKLRLDDPKITERVHKDLTKDGWSDLTISFSLFSCAIMDLHMLAIKVEKTDEFLNILKPNGKKPATEPSDIKGLLIKMLLETRSKDSNVLSVDINVSKETDGQLRYSLKPVYKSANGKLKNENKNENDYTWIIWVLIIGLFIILVITVLIYLYSKHGRRSLM